MSVDALVFLTTLEAAVADGVAFLDERMRVVRAGPAFAELAGDPAVPLAGRPVLEVLPALAAQLEPVLRQVWQTGEPATTTVLEADPEAKPWFPRTWQVRCHPVLTGAGMHGACLVLRDVTEHEAAAALRAALMEDIAEGVCTLDGDGMLTSMNRAATEMLGWTQDELLGTAFADAVRRAAPPASDDVFVRKDGTAFQVACSMAPLPGPGGRTGTVVTFRDVTEARRVELEAHHDQKLESLGRLSAGVAHEINTPIQFVGDNTRFLADAYQEMWQLLLVYRECMDPDLGEVAWRERTAKARQAEADADVEYLIAEIPAAVKQSLEGVERVASLVRAMKSFSYKDAAEQSYADLNEALNTTLTVARNEVKYVADVILELQELPEVLCHRGDLNQVFLNLLVNAADAMQGKAERGTIRIGSRLAGSTVEIRFADDGSGIPDDVRASIFDPFFTTKGVGKGTGQGLALARAVLDRHGGSIEVNSAPGAGTEFVLRLPVNGRPPS